MRTNGLEDAWGVIADPSRRAIVELLADAELAVGELSDRLPISRPAVSQHLRVLKDAGLVHERAVGTRRIYRLNPAGVAALRDQLDTYWSRALAGFAHATGSAADPVADPPRSAGPDSPGPSPSTPPTPEQP